MADRLDFPSGLDDDASEDNVSELLGLYIDRINAGEFVDQSMIASEHPEEAFAIIAELENLQLVGDAGTVPESLRTLGDYTIRRQIGRGGMGVVYEAWENSMDRVVALKVLPAGVAADDRAFQRFMQEAKTAGKLSHQNIVPVYSTGVKDGTPWFSMQFVEGETLAQILARPKEAEHETTPFGNKDDARYFLNLAQAFADVADGLQHAHQKGVTHRDIKPSNLILDGERRLRILDFGLARLEGQESLTLSGDFVGTPLYMSPEQARRKKIAVDHRTDVYSLGATMYEAICGRTPFRGKDHADTLSQIIERDPVDPRNVNSRVPRDLETIVLKCLRKEAGDRYGTAEALGQDLRRFVRGDPIEARVEPVWARIPRRIRRFRTRLVLISVLLSLALALTWAIIQRDRLEYERKQQAYPAEVRAAVTRLAVGRFSLSTGAGQFGSLFRYPRHAPGPLRPEDFDRLLGSEGKVLVREAARDLEQLTARVPEGRDAHYQLARALELLEDKEGARLHCEIALRIDPEFTPARFLLARLLRRALLLTPGTMPWKLDPPDSLPRDRGGSTPSTFKRIP